MSSQSPNESDLSALAKILTAIHEDQKDSRTREIFEQTTPEMSEHLKQLQATKMRVLKQIEFLLTPVQGPIKSNEH